MVETKRGLTKPFGCIYCSMKFETDEELKKHNHEKHLDRFEIDPALRGIEIG